MLSLRYFIIISKLMGCGSLRRCESKNSLSAYDTKSEDTMKEYKEKLETKEYRVKIEMKLRSYINREELQKVYENLFIVREVNPYLEESPMNMNRFMSQAELPRKFSELSQIATKCQKGE
jgi:hypothetical protein